MVWGKGHEQQARGRKGGKIERKGESVGLRQAVGAPGSAAAEKKASVSGSQGSAQEHQGGTVRGLDRAPSSVFCARSAFDCAGP